MAEDELAPTEDDKIVSQAKRRFDACEAWEAVARARFLDDLKFANGDAYNLYQWPQQLYSLRDADNQPCLTINKTRQHCLQIINDGRQNKSSVKVSPVGDEATYEAAQIYEGLVRHIEYISDAQAAYSTASWYQVEGGKGFIRVMTDYASEDGFDQEIYIKRVGDPLTIYMDPDAKELDRSDARFAFAFDDVPKDEFEHQYPQYKDLVPVAPLTLDSNWINKDHVRVAEYFRVVPGKEDRLIAFPDPTSGEMVTAKASEMPEAIRKQALALPGAKVRSISSPKVEWFLIVGETIAERRIWPGTTIPIVPVIGEETVIDGQYDCKGHVRALIDPQRMYNFWTSEATAQVSYQGKTPWVASVASIENLEEYYETANKVAHAVLPYNAYDDKGQLQPPPRKAEPPVMSQAYMAGMQTAANEMALVSGQYQADFGAPSNERSGVAIQQRQRQGENSTYHFIDHFAIAIRRVGKIIIELVPIVYDTKRVLKILGEDGTTETAITVDPNAPQAAQVDKTGEIEKVIFNPSVGKYSVQADIGPSFGTKRQEAFNALTQLAGQSPELMQIGGDLVLRAADFPMAGELAERWQRTIPPNVLGKAPPPIVGQLQQENQALHAMLQQLQQKLEDKSGDISKMAADTAVNAYKAETDRLKVLGADEQHRAEMNAQLAASIAATPLPPQEQSAAPQQAPVMPPPRPDMPMQPPALNVPQ